MLRRTRREILSVLPACFAVTAFGDHAGAAAPASGLHSMAAIRGLFYGAAIATRHLNDPAFVAALLQECGMIVSEWEAQWAALEPVRGKPDYTALDRLVEFAASNGLLFRGHSGIWYKRVPDWFGAINDRAEAERLMLEHVQAKFSRYRGRVQSWDVLNEAVDLRSGRPDGLRREVLLDKFGPGYIDLLFHAARAADPQALLCYNDYGVEYDTPWHAGRREAILALLRGCRSRGVPVDVFGIQAHLRIGARFNADIWARWLDEVAGLGIKLMITEIDVTDAAAPGDIAERDRQVAAEYERFLAPTLKSPAIIGMLAWGLSDRYSWIVRGTEPYHKRPDGLPPRPLPLDADLKRKPAWQAMADAFGGLPSR